MRTVDTDVTIVGAGPTGLMLAGELRLCGVAVAIVDKLAEPMQQSRALGFSARTIEEFDQRGHLPAFGDIGIIPFGHFGGIPLDYRIVEGGSFGVRGVPQAVTESVLAQWAGDLGAEIRRSHELVDLEADGDGVEATFTAPDGTVRLRSHYLVGCDGARSRVRRAAGIGFPGTEATIEMLLADVADVPITLRPSGELSEVGMVVVLPLGPDATRVVVFERGKGVRPTSEPPSFEEVADSFERVTGERIHHGRPLWTSYFTDSSRHATAYRDGRVFLAGDAAHIHLPIGAQGISAGLGDARNVGWKIAAELDGRAPDGLLDTYQSERWPVGARIVANTLTQRWLYLGGPEMDPLRDVFGELMRLDDVQKHLVGAVTGLDIRYDMGPGTHPMLGMRLPKRDILIDGAKTTTYDVLHRGGGVLLDLADDPRLRRVGACWADRVTTVTATGTSDTGTDLPSVLVRPDGYVAWVAANSNASGLAEALTRWFGEPLAAP